MANLVVSEIFLTGETSSGYHLSETQILLYTELEIKMNIKKIVGLWAARVTSRLVRDLIADGVIDGLFELAGTQCAFQVATLEKLGHLSDCEFKVYSQWGEDGILEWLVSKLPSIPERFIEFGVEDYVEANTRFLLTRRNWRGLVIDGSAENIRRCRSRSYFWRHDLAAISAFITAENINDLFLGQSFTGDIGILSIDIDGNDYWVWKAIETVTPWIVVCEYNAVFGDRLPLAIPYQADFDRLSAHFSGLYCGASISALEYLASQKGYKLLGSNLVGTNAFFVRDDLIPTFEGIIMTHSPRQSVIRESRNKTGELVFLRGMERLRVIEHLPVINVSAGETRPLREFGELYSEYWREK